MKTLKEEELREEFNEKFGMKEFSTDTFVKHATYTKEVADWWLDKFREAIAERDEEIKKIVKTKLLERMMKYDSKDGYSTLHDEILEKVSNDVDNIFSHLTQE